MKMTLPTTVVLFKSHRSMEGRVKDGHLAIAHGCYELDRGPREAPRRTKSFSPPAGFRRHLFRPGAANRFELASSIGHLRRLRGLLLFHQHARPQDQIARDPFAVPDHGKYPPGRSGSAGPRRLANEALRTEGRGCRRSPQPNTRAGSPGISVRSFLGDHRVGSPPPAVGNHLSTLIGQALHSRQGYTQTRARPRAGLQNQAGISGDVGRLGRLVPRRNRPDAVAGCRWRLRQGPFPEEGYPGRRDRGESVAQRRFTLHGTESAQARAKGTPAQVRQGANQPGQTSSPSPRLDDCRVYLVRPQDDQNLQALPGHLSTGGWVNRGGTRQRGRRIVARLLLQQSRRDGGRDSGSGGGPRFARTSLSRREGS